MEVNIEWIPQIRMYCVSDPEQFPEFRALAYYDEDESMETILEDVRDNGWEIGTIKWRNDQ